MTALFLLLLAFISLPGYPVIALLCVSGAFWSARHWSGEWLDTFEMLVFYGALIGCLVVWFAP